ncbi:hypothetical protein EDC01DRAFT_425088 [Geopyxis carbonaria]|nr:hypothetical protein EDC01DRAFT_425088 [Geopyxis carbonaria]
MSLSLVPVTLKEASLDSPTFRGTVFHYAEQVDLVEKWLDGFIKASTKLVNEVVGLEEHVNNFLFRAVPTNVSENIVDHDYTLLAMEKYVEGSRGFWGDMIAGAKKVEKTVVEPLLAFQRIDLKNFKEIRRTWETAQAKYDSLLARFLSQSKSKEPSSLREDAFQLYEARKAYMKVCYDFCVAAPSLRAGLDRTLTKVLSDLWREQTSLRKDSTGIAERCRTDIERIRSWSDAMDSNAVVFRKQLVGARKELEERSKREHQPGRELDEYSISTVPYLTSRGSMGGGHVPSEKQGWLFMRTMTGKPTRSVWIRRWFFVRAGIFGWLVQGYRGGGVEESEKIGVLLCNIKPAFQEERRFCFEVKTKDTTILLQTETQPDLTSWLAVFEQAKRTAVESAASTQAFSIIPPSAPLPPSEPAYITRGHDGNNASSIVPASTKEGGDGLTLHIRGHLHRGRDDDNFSLGDRSLTLGPGIGGGSGALNRGASMDVGRDPVSPTSSGKLGQRLDLHRKTLSNTAERGTAPLSPTMTSGPVGISALIAASHNMLQFQPADAIKPVAVEPLKAHSLTPNSLIGTPAPLNLLNASGVTSGSASMDHLSVSDPSAAKMHRKTVSLDIADNGHVANKDGSGSHNDGENVEYPPGYPIELRAQDEHHRMLFLGRGKEVTLLVFRGTWSPNDTQELPGRCYVTEENFYFYSYYMGLVFTSTTPFAQITEVKAAPERDCDYLFLQLKPDPKDPNKEGGKRITIKTFLEPLRLLQRRLHFLVRNVNDAADGGSARLPAAKLLPRLIEMEKEVEEKTADTESWEDVGFSPDASPGMIRRREGGEELEFRIRHETSTGRGIDDKAKEAPRLKLPSTPVVYVPKGMPREPSFEREFEVSPQALFHVMFGDKSPIFQSLYAERRAQHIRQGVWEEVQNSILRRSFAYQVQFLDILGRSRKADVVDHQTIEKQEEHLCYVISDLKTPWHLPHRQDFMLVSAIVITHVAPSKCKLAIWTRVDWTKEPRFSKGIVEKQALDDLENDALDLGDVVAEQVRKLGNQSGSKKAIHIYGTVGGRGQETSVQFSSHPSASSGAAARAVAQPVKVNRRPITQRRLSKLLLETVLSFTESAVSSVLLWIFALLRTACSILSAHRLLVAVLALSLLTNTLLSTRASTAFWSERRAAQFLHSAGVAPNGIMARAVHVSDLLDAAQPNATAALAVTYPGGPCYTKFADLYALDPVLDVAPARGGGAMAKRIRAGRNRLANVRHDLLVALRLVNRLERDLVAAEWERWVRGETGRCAAVAAGGMDVAAAAGALQRYCDSCGVEWRGIEGRAV